MSPGWGWLLSDVPCQYRRDHDARGAATTVEAIKAEYRDAPVIIRTQEELTAFIDQVSAASAGQHVSSMVELSRADDPWGFQIVTAGIGVERGFVQVSGDPEYRTTVGEPDAAGEVVYDYMANATEIPSREEVPLTMVRAILAAYLDHGGAIPGDFQGLCPAESR